jgi:hypothetical protein
MRAHLWDVASNRLLGRARPLLKQIMEWLIRELRLLFELYRNDT